MNRRSAAQTTRDATLTDMAPETPYAVIVTDALGCPGFAALTLEGPKSGNMSIDSLRTRYIRTERITSYNPGDSLLFFGDSSIVFNHVDEHIYVAPRYLGYRPLRIQCQSGDLVGPGSNHTLLNRNVGNVGIGTTSPQAKLHVQGKTYSTTLSVNTQSTPAKLTVKASNTSPALEVQDASGNAALRVNADGTVIAGQFAGANSFGRLCVGDASHYIKGMWGKGLSLSTYLAEDALFIQEGTGKVAIGNITPPNNGSIYKLYVEGGITTRDVKVTANAFPDYVFKDDYELPTIYELADYIDRNGHLPGIPSEADVVASEGYELGNMQLMLLQKLEEQTLYIIELQKQLDALKCKVYSIK